MESSNLEANISLPESELNFPGTPSIIGHESPVEDIYRRKYFVLKSKCEHTQLTNERILNRIYQVKKCLRRLRKERKFLMKKLDQYGDEYHSIPFSIPAEDNPIFDYVPPISLLVPPPPYPNSSAGILAVSTSALFHSSSPVGYPSPQADSLTNTSALFPDVSPSEPSSFPSASSNGPNTGKRKSKNDKDKDPYAPKKPANAFFMFCQEKRNIVIQQYFQEHSEEIGHHELTKTLAKNWNNLNTKEKKVYYDMYEREKERYEREMKEYAGKEFSLMEGDDDDDSFQNT